MKIIVNNESEKKWLKEFFQLVNDSDGLYELCRYLEESNDGIPTGYEDFIRDGLFRYTQIEVDENEAEFTFEDAFFITGTCKNCGASWEGIEPDFGDLTVKEAESILNGTKQGDSFCYTCYSENRCEECGEIYPDVELVRSEDFQLCKTCKDEEQRNQSGEDVS